MAKKTANKIIFLDVDGVLNCASTEERIWRDKGKSGYKGVEDGKVALLARIVKETGAAIVLSSTWRLNTIKNVFDNYIFYEDLSEEEYAENYRKKRTPLRYLTECLKKHKLKIYDMTMDSGKVYGRGEEINTWLDEHPEVTHFVILDDEEFSDFKTYNLDNHVVYTTYGEGLTEYHVAKAIQHLTMDKSLLPSRVRGDDSRYLVIPERFIKEHKAQKSHKKA